MTALPTDAVADLYKLVAELEQRLESNFAAHDAAIARQAATDAENGRLIRELSIARERQTASADILRTIANASGDAERALYQIAEASAHLFGAPSATIHIAEGDGWARTIRVGESSKRVGAGVPDTQLKIGGRNMPGTIVGENRQVHVPDVDNVDPEIADWPGLPYVREAGTRSMSGSPLRLEGKAIGALIVYRDQLAPFTEDELALQQSFADQAAIAIENARLFNEAGESLARQTATSDILKVISQSPTDVQPVFDAIVLTAVRLFKRDRSSILLCDGTSFSPKATAGPEGLLPNPDATPAPIDPDANFPSRAIVSRKNLHLPDWSAIDLPEYEQFIRDTVGLNSALYLPLLREAECIGVLLIAGTRAGAFDDDEIALAESFRDQALIAIENTRLFNETKEALERQTATADILKVIAGSPSDVQPVFAAIAASAKRLLGGFSTTVLRFIGDELHLVAYTPTDPAADETLKTSFPRRLAEFPTFALVRNGETVQFADTESDDVPQPNKELARLRGFRSVLFTPLMNQGTPVGMISVTRAEPGVFASHHVQLLQTFADQAVIAIENVRLFNETQEALERQTATADILRVIASSPDDVQPAFDAIAASSKQLLGGFSATVFRFVDGIVNLAAYTPVSPAADKVLKASFPRPAANLPFFELAKRGEVVQEPDSETNPDAGLRELARARGFRSSLFSPLMSKGAPIGLIVVTRKEPGTFADHHVQLLRTFADQAVIAIENVRLFNEVKQRTDDLSESLQQQTATADVLKVISRSAFDLQAVFDTLLTSAVELSGASSGTICVRDGDIFPYRATVGATASFAQFLAEHPATPGRHSTAGRVILSGEVICIPDVLEDREFTMPVSLDDNRTRAHLGVPLLRNDKVEGALVLVRSKPGLFDERQIELVKTFADQAVIAIENVRLFDEVQARTRDLTEALTYQTGSGNILKVIASSPTDVGPILRAIADSACELCEAYDAIVHLRDGDYLRYRAHHGPLPFGFEKLPDREGPKPFGVEKLPISRDWVTGRSVVDKVPVHLHDVLSNEGDEFPEAQRLSRREGTHTILSVPMLREGESIGAIVLRRTEVHPFSDKQINLLQTFADQAVIAIGNVGLFDEVQAKTRDLSEALTYQTGSGNILRVIASSPTDVKPVLTAIVESACELCEADDALATLRDGDELVFQAQHGSIPVVWQRQPIDREGAAGLAVIKRAPVHVHDLLAPEGEQFPRAREFARITNVRTVLCVPLLREGESIGAIVLRRTEVRPFSDKQIALLQTFADQAVIAIGNVRLFEEVQAKTRDLSESLQQQTATADVLQVISESVADPAPVFDKILDGCGRLFNGTDMMVFLVENDEALSLGAIRGPDLERVERVRRFHPRPLTGTVTELAIRERRLVTFGDVFNDPGVPEGLRRVAAEVGETYSIAIAPMLWKDRGIGAIAVTRFAPLRAFDAAEQRLLQTFADQAVIAIQNADLFNQAQTRTRELSASLDDLRTAQDRLVQTEKLASLGQLTAGIAHEIKNPLNFVNNFAALSAELTDELNDVLKQAEITDKIREEVNELTGLLKDNLQKVVQHGKRADSIVKNMLLHSREGSGDHRPADINALIDESLNLAYHGARAERPDFNVTLQRDFDANAGMIEVFPQEITRVFLNLVSNGFYAVAKRKGEDADSGFDPILSATTRNLGDAVEIRIRDNGTGIPPEVKDKMFNPFFTTKPAGEGTGLGLSMSHDIIVKQHGGTIDVDTEPGHFTEFRIVLPRTSNPPNKTRGQS